MAVVITYPGNQKPSQAPGSINDMRICTVHLYNYVYPTFIQISVRKAIFPEDHEIEISLFVEVVLTQMKLGFKIRISRCQMLHCFATFAQYH